MAHDVIASARARNRDFAAGAGNPIPRVPPARRNPIRSHTTHGVELGAKVRAAKAAGRATPAQIAEYEAGGRVGPGQAGGAFRVKSAQAAGRSVAGATSDAIGSVGSAANAVSTPTGRTSIVIRLIVAFGVALVALELASYISGRYFTWDLKSGAQRVQDAGTVLGLYPGQKDKLAGQEGGDGDAGASAGVPSSGARRATPSVATVPGVVQTA